MSPDGCSPILSRYRENVCLDDARPIPLTLSCRWRGVGSCSIPKGYVWNATTGTLLCEDDDICGDNATDAYTDLNLKIDEAGGELLYQGNEEDEHSYMRVVGISCDDDYDPQIAFFSIPIFDFRIWVLLYVLAAMFLFLHKIKN